MCLLRMGQRSTQETRSERRQSNKDGDLAEKSGDLLQDASE